MKVKKKFLKSVKSENVNDNQKDNTTDQQNHQTITVYLIIDMYRHPSVQTRQLYANVPDIINHDNITLPLFCHSFIFDDLWRQTATMSRVIEAFR